MHVLFELRGPLPKRASHTLNFLGVLTLIIVWQTMCTFGGIHESLLPTPWNVLTSIQTLFTKYDLVNNVLYSLKLNFIGYMVAIAVSIPLGFLLGLVPLFRELFEKQFNSMRFIPLVAVTGMFVAWCGIGDYMKIMFLAVSIILYLVPITIQRIKEVDQVLIDTARTLNASWWQQIQKVYFPQAASTVFADVKNIVAISWTYIIIAELLNRVGGIGAMIYLAVRDSRMDCAFMLLFIIVLIGFFQDRLFGLLDQIFFPHKYRAGKL